jgi:hypothetical protein
MFEYESEYSFSTIVASRGADGKMADALFERM